jgi:tRNA threonylcarbamoyladenosine biosynthesis protein TsaB
MRLLALDSATVACSAALWRDDRVRARRFEAMERGQAEALMPMVLAVLDQGGCGFADLDAVAVTVGPGAFTGLRIGLAAARGIALAADLPVLGVTTMEAVAHGAAWPGPGASNLLVALDSKRRDRYLQPFDAALAPLAPPVALLPAAIAAMLTRHVPPGPLAVVGDAAAEVTAALADSRRYTATQPDAPALPDAAVVARLAAARLRSTPRRDWRMAPPAPLYLRPPVVAMGRAVGRARRTGSE